MRQLRKEIIENNILESNNNNSNLSNTNIPKTNNINNKIENESKLNSQVLLNQENEIIRKELEKLELLKKQQLFEIKNLIDYEYDINETRKKNELKDKENKEKEEKKRLEKLK